MADLVTNLLLSTAFSFASSWLTPRKQDKTPDSLPNPNFGENLYKAWGTAVVPGYLCYALDPGLNDRVQIDKYNYAEPSEAASYANFLLSNPQNCKLLAIRISGKVAASSVSFAPIYNGFKGARLIDAVTGLERVNDFKFRFLDGTQTTSDRIFQKGGNGGLVYKGQTVLVVDSARRALYGGRGTSVSCILTNNTETAVTTAGGAYGFNNSPISIRYKIIGTVFEVANNLQQYESYSLPNGLQFSQQVATFRDTPSITDSNARPGLMLFGTGSEFFVGTGKALAQPEITNGNTGIVPSGIPGSFTRVTYTQAAVSTSILTTQVILASPGQLTRIYELATPAISPFYCEGNEIKSANGLVVGVCSSSDTVIGWEGKIYTIGTPLVNTALTPSSATGVIRSTTLKRIITDLLADRDIPYVFKPGFDAPITGFLTNKSDVSGDISNLLTINQKIVYQRRDGTIVFAPNPSRPVSSGIVTILPEHHASPPEIEITGNDSVPDSVLFGFRDIERQFDSSTIRVGGDSLLTTDVNMEITATSTEARTYAQNMRSFLRSQVVKGTLHLHSIGNSITPGDVVKLKGLGGEDVDYFILIVRAETGVDCSVRLEFINHTVYAPISGVLVSSSSISTNVASIASDVRTYALDTEPRSSRRGIQYYTESASPITHLGQVSSPVRSGLSGAVRSLTIDTMTLDTQGVPVTGQDYYLLDTSNGEGSWFKFTTVTKDVDGLYRLSGVTQGLYNSNQFTTFTPGQFTVYQLNELSVFDDSYESYQFIQSGGIYEWLYPTQKRYREPKLTNISAVSNGTGGWVISFNRNNLFGGGLKPGVIIALKSIGVGVPEYTVSCDLNSITYSIDTNYTPGQVIEIYEYNITTGLASTGAIINTITI